MYNFLQLSNATINLAHFIFINWDDWEDSRFMKRGIRVHLTTGSVFIASDDPNYEQDSALLSVITGRLKKADSTTHSLTSD